jgi:dTDP-4-dehydrorhamnose 3,5-epimerase
MLKGVIIKLLKQIPDERGFFTEVMRKDWKKLFLTDNLAQANLSFSYPNIIRAWHRHKKGQTDYFTLLEGAIKICIFDEKTAELAEIISTGKNLQTIRVPGHYWHGFKVISMNPAKLLYFTTKLYNYNQPDEDRRPWNDYTIIPKTINGREDDPRVGKPWDWYYSPNK